MAHRQDTGRIMRPSPLVVALALLIVTVVVVIGVVRSLGTGGVDVPQVELPAPVVNPPVATNTPKPTATSAPTATPTPTPTATPTPRLWTREQYEEFMNFMNPGGGHTLLQSGWYLYDGVELLDDYPCLNYCSSSEVWEESNRLMLQAYEASNDADFWCEWACDGVYSGFGERWAMRIIEYDLFVYRLGNRAHEPYCPQFESTEYAQFRCNTTPVLPTMVPSESLGWSHEVRSSIEDNYLYPILNGGFDRWPGQDLHLRDDDPFENWDINITWTSEYVVSLPDTYVCWIIANGHYYFGWPEYDITSAAYPDGELGRFRELRLELRAKLNRELGEPVDGNPPLCPGFLDMIESPSLP